MMADVKRLEIPEPIGRLGEAFREAGHELYLVGGSHCGRSQFGLLVINKAQGKLPACIILEDDKSCGKEEEGKQERTDNGLASARKRRDNDVSRSDKDVAVRRDTPDAKSAAGWGRNAVPPLYFFVWLPPAVSPVITASP